MRPSQIPSAVVATEVGCCEIAALIKRDLGLDVPLVAVNINPDMDKAWVKPEVDLYCFATDESLDELIMHGARRDRVVNWGPAISGGFADRGDRLADRSAICLNLALDSRLPIVVIAGGGEGIGRIEEITSRLLQTRIDPPPQFVVLKEREILGTARVRVERRLKGLIHRASKVLTILRKWPCNYARFLLR